MTKLALATLMLGSGFVLAVTPIAFSPGGEPVPPPGDVYVQPSTRIPIGDDYLSCSVGSLDVLVHYEPDNAIEIAYTDHTQVGPPQIVLGRRFRDFSPQARAFIFLHECGHAIRGHYLTWEGAARTEEPGLLADCFAARETVRLGYFNDAMLADLRQVLWPERLDTILACASSVAPPKAP